MALYFSSCRFLHLDLNSDFTFRDQPWCLERDHGDRSSRECTCTHLDHQSVLAFSISLVKAGLYPYPSAHLILDESSPLFIYNLPCILTTLNLSLLMVAPPTSHATDIFNLNMQTSSNFLDLS